MTKESGQATGRPPVEAPPAQPIAEPPPTRPSSPARRPGSDAPSGPGPTAASPSSAGTEGTSRLAVGVVVGLAVAALAALAVAGFLLLGGAGGGDSSQTAAPGGGGLRTVPTDSGVGADIRVGDETHVDAIQNRKDSQSDTVPSARVARNPGPDRDEGRPPLRLVRENDIWKIDPRASGLRRKVARPH